MSIFYVFILITQSIAYIFQEKHLLEAGDCLGTKNTNRPPKLRQVTKSKIRQNRTIATITAKYDKLQKAEKFFRVSYPPNKKPIANVIGFLLCIGLTRTPVLSSEDFV